MAKTVSVYDIIKGLNQAAANAYDGSHDERFVETGYVKEIGLKREEGCPIKDSRVIDGFKVRIAGSKLIVTYQSEIPMKDFHNSKLDEEIEHIYKDIIKFLKKEYKSITGNTVTLTPDCDADIFVQNMSRIRTWVEATKVYTVGGLKDVQDSEENNLSTSDEKLRSAVEKFLAIGKDKYPGTKKPRNAIAQKSAKKTNNANA